MKKSESRQNKTSLNAGLPSEQSEIRYNIYDEKGFRVGIDSIISESEIRLPNATKHQVVSPFCPNLAVGISKPLSPLVLAKRLGFSLCQVFELIEAGAIICRNGLIPAEEAERLLHPKIEKV